MVCRLQTERKKNIKGRYGAGVKVPADRENGADEEEGGKRLANNGSMKEERDLLTDERRAGKWRGERLEGSGEGLLKSGRGETKLMKTGSMGKKWRKLQVSRFGSVPVD